jgi:hypothetical protein
LIGGWPVEKISYVPAFTPFLKEIFLEKMFPVGHVLADSDRVWVKWGNREKVQVTLPSRLYVVSDPGGFRLVEQPPTPTWVDLTKVGVGRVSLAAKTVYFGSTYELDEEIRVCGMPPMVLARDLEPDSPWASIFEGMWFGRDRFREVYGDKKRVELFSFGDSVRPDFALSQGDTLHWQLGEWVGGGQEGGESCQVALLEDGFIAWRDQECVRLPFPPRKEEDGAVSPESLFSSLRMRSSKEASCSLEKQCFILRAGDWIVKTKRRWKLLRSDRDKQLWKVSDYAEEVIIIEEIQNDVKWKGIRGVMLNARHTEEKRFQLTPFSNRQEERVKHKQRPLTKVR